MHVITGASSGIGRGIATALARRGEMVVAVARRDRELADLVDEAGPNVTPVVADVTTADGRQAVASASGADVVHSIVHGAASVVELCAWRDLDAERLVEHFRVHVAAPIAMTQALLRRGRLERMAILDSYAATTPRIGWSAYAMLKAAAQMSARGAAAELTDPVVIRIFPGAVQSPLLDQVLGDQTGAPAAEFYRTLAAEGRVSDPVDVGREIATLLVDEPIESLRATEVWHVGHPA